MQTHTADSLSTLLTHQIEPDHADHVLHALTPLNGQLITTRILDKLPGGRVEWRIRREAGTTTIRNRAYIQSRGDSADALDLTLAKTEASVPLDIAWIERENGRYFAARRQRNAQRTEAINDRPLLTRLATVMNAIVDLNAKLTLAKRDFTDLTERGGPDHGCLFPDRYELERACGLREGK